MPWYSTGTVAVTNGSTAVTADGSKFIGNVKPGDIFAVLNDGHIYEIDQIVSSTQLTLKRPYAGANGTGLGYDIIPSATFLKSLAAQVADLIALYNAVPQGVADSAASAEAAAKSATASANSATAAASSKDAAAASATASANSASAAALSESHASTSEANAAASKGAAATSAANAKTAEVNAADSASAAKTAETNAKASESVTSASQAAAAAAAANAKTSETNAAASQSAATTAASNAKASETNAAASKNAAAMSASNAKTSETNAAASANSIGNAETNAKASADAAAKSATDAAASAAVASGAMTNALTKANNLSDVADKAAARSNLDVPTNAALATKVSKAGDTMTGPLTLASTSDWSPLFLSANGYVPRIQADNTSKSINFVNGANTAANMWILDNGQVSVRGNLTVGGTAYAGGNNATVAPDGNVWGTKWGGWLADWMTNNKVNRGGDTMWGRLSLTGPNWQADLGLRSGSNDNTWTYLRARQSGGIDVINNAYNMITWALDDWGNMFTRGMHVMQTNGNLFCQYRNAWMSDILNDLYNRDDSKIDWGNANARWNNSWQVADHLFEARWDGRSINMFIDHTFVAYVASNASDMRLKTNIAPTQEDSLGKVNALAFKQFDWRSDGRQQSLGLIAQQAKTVDESFVRQSPGDRLDPSTCPMMLDTNALLLTALHAIQQLSAEVSALKAQLVPAA